MFLLTSILKMFSKSMNAHCSNKLPKKYNLNFPLKSIFISLFTSSDGFELVMIHCHECVIQSAGFPGFLKPARVLLVFDSYTSSGGKR